MKPWIESKRWPGHSSPAVVYPDEPALYIRPNNPAESDVETGFWFVCHDPTQRTFGAFDFRNAVLFMNAIVGLAVDWGSIHVPDDLPKERGLLVRELITECGGRHPPPS